jgi:hypothetical protein
MASAGRVQLHFPCKRIHLFQGFLPYRVHRLLSFDFGEKPVLPGRAALADSRTDASFPALFPVGDVPG